MLPAPASILEVDLETFGEELTKRYTCIVNYQRPEMLATDGIKEKFYKAAQRIHEQYPEELRKYGQLTEELGKVLNTIQDRDLKSWEEMTTHLTEMIIQEQQARIREYKEKAEQYDATREALDRSILEHQTRIKEEKEKAEQYDVMREALERNIQKCSKWKDIALGQKRYDPYKPPQEKHIRIRRQ